MQNDDYEIHRSPPSLPPDDFSNPFYSTLIVKNLKTEATLEFIIRSQTQESIERVLPLWIV